MTEKVQRLETGDGLKKSLDMSWNYTFLQHKLRKSFARIDTDEGRMVQKV